MAFTFAEQMVPGGPPKEPGAFLDPEVAVRLYKGLAPTGTGKGPGRPGAYEEDAPETARQANEQMADALAHLPAEDIERLVGEAAARRARMVEEQEAAVGAAR